MKLERDIQKEVIKWLKANDIFYFKISERFSSGIPDLYILHNGISVWIELKTEKGVLSKLQALNLMEIQKHKGNALVCRSLDQVKYLLAGMYNIPQELIPGS